MSAPNLFFSTPVWTNTIKNYKETNEEIYNYIKKLQEVDERGIVKSNVNGWHSKNFNLKDEIPKKFINMISPDINQVFNDMEWDLGSQITKITNMWTIINKNGAANSRHHHGNSAISAAYYVRAPKNCGDIVFYDPRPAPIYFHPNARSSNSLNCQVNKVTPVEGALVLFPSYLDHSVDANNSNEERVVISFNISFISKNYIGHS